MSEAMKLALTFTAADAASNVIGRLENNLRALGAEGKKVMASFEATKDHLFKTAQGLGVAYTSMKLAEPGLAAAASLETLGLKARTSLDNGRKSASELNVELGKLNNSAISLSQSIPVAAAEAAEFQNLLLKRGFSAEDITAGGLGETALALAQLKGVPGESMAELMEQLREQFKVAGPDEMKGLLNWMQQAGAKPDEIRSALARTGQQMHALGVSAKDAITVAGYMEHVGRPGGALDALMGSMLGMAGNPQSDAARVARAWNLNFFRDGQFVGFDALQEQLKTRFVGADAVRRQTAFKLMFGEAGDNAALGLFDNERLTEFSAAAARRDDAITAIHKQNEGLSASFLELRHAVQNTMAALFAPWTPGLAKMARAGKDVTAGFGDLFRDYPGLAKLTTGFIGLAAAAGLVYAGIHGWKALVSAGGVLAGLKGLGLNLFGGATNLAKGVAEGKALQAAAGVTPVFVTNFPAGMGLGGAASAVGAGMILDKWGKPIATAAAGAVLGKAALLKGAAGLATIPNLLTGGAVLGSGLYGYEVGKRVIAPFADWAADKTGLTPWQWLTERVEDYSRRAAAGAINKITIDLNVDREGKLVTNTTGAASVDISNNTARGTYGS